MKRFVTLLAPAALLALFTHAATAGETRPLAYDDVFLLEAVSDPQPSPDGESVVFVRNWMDRQSDRTRSQLWIIDADGNNLEPLTNREDDAASPRWSPDGERIAYVSDGQVRMLWPESGRDSRISELEHAPSGLTWSPDGQWLAFAKFTPADKEGPVSLPGRPEGADWAEPPIWIEEPEYRADGQGYLDPGHDHIHLLPAEGGSAIRLTRGDFDHQDPAWHPEGEYLYTAANRHEDARRYPLKSSLYRIDPHSREMQAVTEGTDPQRSPLPSPDGQHLAWLGFEDQRLSHQANRLYVAESNGGEPRNLTEDLDRDIEQAAWDGEDALLIAYDHHGTTRLAHQYLDGSREVLSENLGGEYFSRPYSSGQFAVSESGLITHTRVATDRPAELGILDGEEAETLTDINRDFLKKRDIGSVEDFWYTSSVDGLDLQGWVIHPPDFDPEKRYPMILEIHGGPFATYGAYFAMELQLMAAQGYVVVYLNPRGSTSYGEDFANEIHHHYPGDDHHDLMDGVDEVIERGYINEEELFITGGSGGGVLTTWAISQTDRFAAAAAVNPVINWYSFVLNADLYQLFTQYWFPGLPWDLPEHYLAHSPIHQVGSVETPTLLLTGEEDWRTPISETEQYYQALQLQDVDTAMVRVPDASHALHARPSNLMAKAAYIIYWFERYRD